jgi:crotonobetainyl-CoA:carnitine CoA-transferase CaiB-like acyl-CoA transferase
LAPFSKDDTRAEGGHDDEFGTLKEQLSGARAADGVTVFNLCSYLVGCTFADLVGCTFADLGARFIKIESSDDDMLAQFPLGRAGEPVLSPHQPWQEGDRIVAQRADDPGRALWLSGQRRTRRPARFGAGRPTGVRPTKNGALYISEYSNHFFVALCKLSPGRNWAAIPAVPRCADAPNLPPNSCRNGRWR